MISWIQKYFQRHFSTVFAVLLAGTIIAFVLGINTSGGFGRATPEGEHQARPFYGLDLATREDNDQLMEAAGISAHLQLGLDFDITLPQDRIQSYALQRHAAIWLADQLHVPAPDATQLDDFIKGLRLFADSNGKFNPAAYSTFRDKVKHTPQLDESTIGHVISDDARVHQVESLLAGPGYILPDDVSAALELNESSWSVELATVDYASFNPKLEPTDADLQKFFTEHPVEIPVQVGVDAISFPKEAFLDKVTVTEAEERRIYSVNPAAFPKPADKSSPPPLLAKPADQSIKTDDFAAVQPAVEAAVKQDKASRMAVAAAADFAVTLYNQKATPSTLGPLLAANHLTRQQLAPFARDAKVAELGNDPENAAKAFRLDSSHPFSDEVETPGGAVILVWRETIPARKPAFDEVKDQVAASWRAAEKKRLFSELGRTLHDRIAAALKAGTPFKQAVTDAAPVAASAKLDVTPIAGFTLEQKREAGSFDPLYHVLDALAPLQKGQVADMVIVANEDDQNTPGQGQLVYAVDKKLPDLSPTGAQYGAARTQLAAKLAAYSASTVLGDLVQRELAKSAPAQP